MKTSKFTEKTLGIEGIFYTGLLYYEFIWTQAQRTFQNIFRYYLSEISFIPICKSKTSTHTLSRDNTGYMFSFIFTMRYNAQYIKQEKFMEIAAYAMH
jgi:hypothetical protein